MNDPQDIVRLSEELTSRLQGKKYDISPQEWAFILVGLAHYDTCAQIIVVTLDSFLYNTPSAKDVLLKNIRSGIGLALAANPDIASLAGKNRAETPLPVRASDGIHNAAGVSDAVFSGLEDHFRNQTLYNACRNGDNKSVGECLEGLRFPQETLATDNHFALFSAAQNGHVDTVRLVLEKGYGDGQSRQAALAANQHWSLRCAAKRGHADTVRLVLESYADDQSRQAALPADNHFALFAAAQNGYASTIQLLLGGGRDDQFRNAVFAADWHASLCAAAERGHTDTVRLLLESYTDDQSRQAALAVDDHFPLRTAARNGHVDTVRLLLESYTDDQSRQAALAAGDHFALCEAVRACDISTVLQLRVSYTDDQWKGAIVSALKWKTLLDWEGEEDPAATVALLQETAFWLF